MKPVVNGFEREYGDRVDFRRIDIDDENNAEIVQKYKVSGVPVYVFLDGNEEALFTHSGSRTPDQLKSDLKKLLQP
jgi:thioredoxin-like negative regulator of GroEL